MKWHISSHFAQLAYLHSTYGTAGKMLPTLLVTPRMLLRMCEVVREVTLSGVKLCACQGWLKFDDWLEKNDTMALFSPVWSALCNLAPDTRISLHPGRYQKRPWSRSTIAFLRLHWVRKHEFRAVDAETGAKYTVACRWSYEKQYWLYRLVGPTSTW
jgi:hypothetical protein